MNYAWGTYGGCSTAVVVGLALLGFVGATLGCAPATYMAPELGMTEPMTFAELLEVERNVIAGRFKLNARVPAHFISQKVDGSSEGTLRLDHPSAPDAYTIDSSPSTQSWQYHMGYAAQRLIAEHYAATHPRHVVFRHFTSIRRIVEEADGNLYALNPYLEDQRPDLVDVDARVVYEIKPYGPNHLEKGKATVTEHLRVINVAMDGEEPFKIRAGFRGEVGVRFDDDVPAWKVEWECTEGVVQYRWRRLDTEDDDEDDCRDAYEANRWKDLTAEEMALHARRMHQVVEHLVRERESMSQTRAAESMPLVVAGTSVNFERSTLLWSRGDISPWLLPVMEKPPVVASAKPAAQVRPDPRWVAETSRAGSSPKMHPGATKPDKVVFPPHPSAPEGYTLDGLFGNMPWQYFMGYSAHRLIAYHYEVHHPIGTIYKNFISVATIVKRTSGNEALLPWSVADLRPDIAHVTPTTTAEHYVYEIKPRGDVHLEKGKVKLAQYIGGLNLGMVGTSKLFGPGPKWDGKSVVTFKNGLYCWYLEWDTTAPGILQYKWYKLNPLRDADGKATDTSCAQAQREGKWTDLSRREMEEQAEALFLDVEKMVSRREMIGRSRDGTTPLIDAVGALAEAILSAGLWNQLEVGPRIITKPAPGVQPTIPKAPPPVNAPSLGSDTHPGPIAPRPAAPGKTPSGPTNVSPN